MTSPGPAAHPVRRVLFSPAQAGELADAIAAARAAAGSGARALGDEERLLLQGAAEDRPVVLTTDVIGVQVFEQVLRTYRRVVAAEDHLLAVSDAGMDVLAAADLLVAQAEIRGQRAQRSRIATMTGRQA